ncbi:MAG: hypothetical protein GEU88_04085 [Solirubrobacterales bacterium]|nr:hypothetical protein [Solirubrobacterales bacterium]
MDVGKLRTGELIAGVSAIVLFIVMFLPWYGIGGAAGEVLQQAQDLGFAPDVDTTASAWQSFGFIDIVLFVTIIVAVAFAAATAMSQSVALPVAASAITAGLGILSTLLVLYRLIDPPGEGDIGREFWLYIGLLAAAGIAYGGWRAMQEEGTSFGAQSDRLQDRMGGGSPPPPPSEGRPPASGGPAA